MPKTRLQKEAIITETTDQLDRAAAVVFLSMTGVKVTDMERMRDALFPHGLTLQIAKNRLLQRVLADKKVEVPAALLDQPLGLVYGFDDPVNPAKVMAPLVKEIEPLSFLGGLMDSAYLEPKRVEMLAALPGREQLLAQCVGTIAAPLSGLVNVLNANLRGLVSVLAQVRDARA